MSKYTIRYEDKVLGHYPGHTSFDALSKMFDKYSALNLNPFNTVGDVVVSVEKPGEEPAYYSITVESEE